MPRIALTNASRMLAMIEAIADEAVFWLSEGKRELWGRMLHVQADKRGLRIHLNTGRSVVWRCSAATAGLVISNLVAI